MQKLGRWAGWPAHSQRIGEQLISAIGSLLGIALVWHSCRIMLGNDFALIMVPSLGATAVLLFAIPHSPLTQPWAVFGGHIISALVGVGCQHCLGSSGLAAACAVALALMAMQILRCIHPPGGATALTAVIGGVSVQALGYRYALTPVALNCLLMIILACVFNYAFPWRRYPIALMPASRPLQQAGGFPVIRHEHIEAAIAKQRVMLDISTEELTEVFRETLEIASQSALTPQQVIHIGSLYGNNQLGPNWGVRRVIDERASSQPEFDLIVYEIIEGSGRGRVDSCPRADFIHWAACEIHSAPSKFFG